ncbi:ankyrin repeat-containing domain protein [Usnea florida]
MINDNKTYDAMASGLEYVSSLIARYYTVENLYSQSSLLKEQLAEALLKLYSAVLVFLARARRYYTQCHATRAWRSVVQTDELAVGKHLNKIAECENRVNEVARIINGECLHEVRRFMEGKLNTELERLGKSVDQINLQSQVGALAEENERLVSWINAISTAEDYDRARYARLEGTCDWILNREEFQAWVAPESFPDAVKILWIQGPPGSGKTFLTTRIIDYLQPRYPVVHFFCFYNDIRKRQPLEIIRSWVLQLVNLSDIACDVGKETYREKVSDIATESKIWRLFKRIVLQIQHFYFVVDGFDECTGEELNSRPHNIRNPRERFLNGLGDSLARTRTKVLFVSRQDLDIRRYVRSSEADSVKWIEYALSARDTNSDIKQFADTLIAHRLPNKPQALREELAINACERCEGMFLWIYSLQRQLKPSSNHQKLCAVVSNVPGGLDQAYERSMQNIVELDDEDKQRAIAILRWVMYASRPLTVQELTEALLVSIDDEDVSGFFPETMLPDEYDECYVEDEILGPCAPFVRLRGEEVHQPVKDQTLHFMHFSVKEYLSSKAVCDNFPKLGQTYFTDEAGAHKLLAQICLRYLCYDDFIQTETLSEENFDAKINKYAFLKYAGRYWTDHKRYCNDLPPELVRWLNELFDPFAQKCLSYLEVIERKSSRSFTDDPRHYPHNYPNPLFYASLWGLVPTMEFLIMERHVHVNVEKQWQEQLHKIGGLYGSPLQAASAEGSIAAVRLLLQHNADVNIGNERSGSSLQTAVAHGRSEIVELLLQHGANPCAKGRYWNSPLLEAASLPGPSRPAEAITRLLLDAGASVHDTTTKPSVIRGETAVHLASSYGCQEVLLLLLRAGADANIAHSWGQTALHNAITRGCKSSIEILLQYGADVDFAPPECWTPLYHAASMDKVESMKTLLDRGANINARCKCPDELGWTPLHVAADAENTAAVQLLLDRGADIEAIADNSYTPLHLAAFKNCPRSVQLLLSYGANTEAKCKDGNVTALYLAITEACAAFETLATEYSAIREPYVLTVKELLDWNADVTTANSDNGWTILHLAVRCGYAPIAKLILEANAPLEPSDGDGAMPIHIAVRQKQYDTLQLLLDFGAAVDVEDSDDSSTRWSEH